jgi:alanine dehydrogenase
MTTAVTVMVMEARRLRLCQPLLRLSHLLLIQTARTLLAGSISSEVAVIFTVRIFRQDVPKLVFTMTIFWMKDP